MSDAAKSHSTRNILTQIGRHTLQTASHDHGSAASAVSSEDLQGNILSLAALAGKIVLIGWKYVLVSPIRLSGFPRHGPEGVVMEARARSGQGGGAKDPIVTVLYGTVIIHRNVGPRTSRLVICTAPFRFRGEVSEPHRFVFLIPILDRASSRRSGYRCSFRARTLHGNTCEIHSSIPIRQSRRPAQSLPPPRPIHYDPHDFPLPAV